MSYSAGYECVLIIFFSFFPGTLFGFFFLEHPVAFLNLLIALAFILNFLMALAFSLRLACTLNMAVSFRGTLK